MLSLSFQSLIHISAAQIYGDLVTGKSRFLAGRETLQLDQLLMLGTSVEDVAHMNVSECVTRDTDL